MVDTPTKKKSKYGGGGGGLTIISLSPDGETVVIAGAVLPLLRLWALVVCNAEVMGGFRFL